MGIQDLQNFLEGGQVEGSCVGVDLLRIARTQAAKWPKTPPHQKKLIAQGVPVPIPVGGKFSIVVDAECCLDRLYGGFFSDWVCGGQWNKVTTFLGEFVTSLNVANIELAVFFNGCTEPARTDEWIQEQFKARNKINSVMRHLSTKGTPPPKVWWTPPSCLRPTLRMVLRNLNVPVFVTMDDHKQEVIAFCRENMYHAIVADDAEYVAFNPPRYFSARHLKLTYKGTLESKEYIIAEMMKGLNLNQQQLCVLAALLGNFLLPESELTDLHKKLNLDESAKLSPKEGQNEPQMPDRVRAVAEFIHTLQSSELNDMAIEIFGVVGKERAEKFRQAVQYYIDGTVNGMFKFRTGMIAKKTKKTNSKGIEIPRLATENSDSVLDQLNVTEAIACLTVGPEILVEKPNSPPSKTDSHEHNGVAANGNLLHAQGSGPSSGATSPSRGLNGVKKTVRLLVEEENVPILPIIPSEIMRTVSERHIKGVMSPLIYQILTEGEVKLPVVMEDETNKEIPSIQHFYRPIRAMVYAILYNLHHLIYMARNNKSEKIPDVKVREWIWSKANPYKKPEVIKAEPLGWGVPTVQRLWFGTTVDDKRRRLRAFLTCMRSDTQLMLNPNYVPQHLLILAAVLRFIMSFPDIRVLRKQELDAIIAMAMDPHLANSDHNQGIQMDYVTTRGIQIGALIMTGIEYGLLVNDTCGAPIPWIMTCPWLYFDGKLLHSTLAKSANVNNLPALCNYRTIQVGNVERMREAILEGLCVQWALPIYTQVQGFYYFYSKSNNHLNQGDPARVHNVMPVGLPPPRAPPVRPVPAPPAFGRAVGMTGGELKIGGVVVSNWGPNPKRNLLMPIQPGFNGRGKSANFSTRGSTAGRGKGRGASIGPMNGKNKKNTPPARKDSGRKQNKGRNGMSVLSPYTGEIVNADELMNQTPKFEERKMILTNTDPKISTTQNGREGLANGKVNNEQSQEESQSAPVLNNAGAEDSASQPLKH